MQKISALIIGLACMSLGFSAEALSYDMQGGLSNPQDCGIENSYWRTDELTQDTWGTYTDPYAYGALPHSDLSYPIRPYAGADDIYYGNSYGASYGSSQVVYDNQYNSAYDTDYYTYGGSQNYYGQGGSMYDTYSVDAIANANLQKAMSGGSYTNTGTGAGTGGSRGGRVAQATAPIYDATPQSTGPKCTLIPRSTGSNNVVLEWQTVGASSAFIDNGVGHVALGTGTRMVTPRVTTTYNMTVVDGRGFSSQCAAIVHVLGGGKLEAGTTITPGTSTTTSTGTTTGGTGETVTNTDGPLSEKAQEITGNVSEKVTSVLSSGQSIWDKMRQMSLVAIGLFFIVFVIIFVMRKMFGGGDEGHH